jgi:hypothetical protein
MPQASSPVVRREVARTRITPPAMSRQADDIDDGNPLIANQENSGRVRWWAERGACPLRPFASFASGGGRNAVHVLCFSLLLLRREPNRPATDMIGSMACRRAPERLADGLSVPAFGFFCPGSRSCRIPTHPITTSASSARHRFSPLPHGSSSAPFRQASTRAIIAGDRLPTTRRTFVCATVKRLPHVAAEV